MGGGGAAFPSVGVPVRRSVLRAGARESSAVRSLGGGARGARRRVGRIPAHRARASAHSTRRRRRRSVTSSGSAIGGFRSSGGMPRRIAERLGPDVCPDARAGLFFPDEAVVDPRKLTRALDRAVRGRGVEVRSDTPVRTLRIEGGRCVGVETERRISRRGMCRGCRRRLGRPRGRAAVLRAGRAGARPDRRARLRREASGSRPARREHVSRAAGRRARPRRRDGRARRVSGRRSRRGRSRVCSRRRDASIRLVGDARFVDGLVGTAAGDDRRPSHSGRMRRAGTLLRDGALPQRRPARAGDGGASRGRDRGAAGGPPRALRRRALRAGRSPIGRRAAGAGEVFG